MGDPPAPRADTWPIDGRRIVILDQFDLTALAPTATGPATPRDTRSVHFGDRWHETAIYDRLALPVGTEIAGPAILEQPDTTVLIEPGLTGTVDRYGNTIITRTETA